MSVRIVPASDVGPLAHLQPLAEQIFGRRDRPSGWFGRKLRRECVRGDLSRVAIRPGGALDDPDAWCGYVLAGTPPSMPGVVRTAGTGVVDDVRGMGVGRKLLESLSAATVDAGLEAVETLASPQAEGFYRTLAFDRHRQVATMVSFADGPTSWLAPGADDWDPPDVVVGQTHHELAAWLPEAWTRSLIDHRVSLSVPTASGVPAWIHLSFEGRAVLAHRVLAPHGGGVRPIAAGLVRILPADTPVLITGIDPGSNAAATLLDLGWAEAQRGLVMRRRP